MNLNKDPSSWARVSAELVMSGSHAQQCNVMRMALHDIAQLAAEVDRLLALHQQPAAPLQHTADDGRDAFRNLMAQLIISAGGPVAPGNVLIREQTIPASVYDAALRAALAKPDTALQRQTADTTRLDWLQGRVVDTIYLDDGKIVDVRGNDLREAIDAATKRWPNSLEDDDGEEKATEAEIAEHRGEKS